MPFTTKTKALWTVRDYAWFEPAYGYCRRCDYSWQIDLSHCALHTKIVDLEPFLVCVLCGDTSLTHFVARPTQYLLERDPHHRDSRMSDLAKKHTASETALGAPPPVPGHPLPRAGSAELVAELRYRGLIRSYEIQRLVQLAERQPTGLKTAVLIVMPRKIGG